MITLKFINLPAWLNWAAAEKKTLIFRTPEFKLDFVRVHKTEKGLHISGDFIRMTGSEEEVVKVLLEKYIAASEH